MQNSDNILEIYQAAKVEGRSQFCPRKGTYRIHSVYEGICLNKPATMAQANWKLNEEDIYSTELFTVQLQSLKTDLKPLNTENLFQREILIKNAEWFPMLPLFAINWELLPKKELDVELLNKVMAQSLPFLDMSQFDKSPSVYSKDGKELHDGDF